MEPLEYLAVLRKRWIAIVLLTLLGAAAALAYALSLPTLYRSTTSVFIASQRGETTSELVQGSTFVQDQVQSYAQLAATPRVLDRVIADLGLETTSRALADSVTADIRLNSVIIDISVSDEDPRQAARLADSVSGSLAESVQDLAPKGQNMQPSIAVEQISPAGVARAPYSPNTRLIVASGLGAGLILGLLYALGREVLDTRIRSAKDLARVTAEPLLGSVARRKTKRKQPDVIAMLADPNSSGAEDYRRVATNIEFADVDSPVRAIVVTSALPGEGKTTSSINLALAMAERLERVLLIDCDLRKPSVGRYTGLDDSVGLTSVLVGSTSFEDAVRPWAGGIVDILPSGLVPANPSQLVGSDTMAQLIDSLIAEYDFIVLDSPPLLPVTDALTLAKITDGAVIVGRAGSIRRHQLDEALQALAVVSARVLGVVLNGTEPNRSEAYRYESDIAVGDGQSATADESATADTATEQSTPDEYSAGGQPDATASLERSASERDLSSEDGHEDGGEAAAEDATDGAAGDAADDADSGGALGDAGTGEEHHHSVEAGLDGDTIAKNAGPGAPAEPVDAPASVVSGPLDASSRSKVAASESATATKHWRAPSGSPRKPRTPNRKPGSAPSRSSG